jgi:Bacterial Ig domain
MIRTRLWGRSVFVALLALLPLQARGGSSTTLPMPDLDLSGPVAQLPPPGGGGGGGGGGGPNSAPTIANFRAAVAANGVVTFTGKVSDDQSVSGLTVRITGGPFGALVITTVTDANGNFSTTATVDPGSYTVSAKATDVLGLTGNPVSTGFEVP